MSEFLRKTVLIIDYAPGVHMECLGRFCQWRRRVFSLPDEPGIYPEIYV
jgi:hypothetical protein